MSSLNGLQLGLRTATIKTVVFMSGCVILLPCQAKMSVTLNTNLIPNSMHNLIHTNSQNHAAFQIFYVQNEIFLQLVPV